MPDFVENASEFLVDRVAPILAGRRGRNHQLRLDDLERQAREELDARIQLGRPVPSEWPDADEQAPVPKVSPPERVPVDRELQVMAVRMNIPASPTSRPHAPRPVMPSRRG